MKTERLIESGVIQSGDPRHFSAWRTREHPRLRPEERDAVSEALYRRQRAHAPKVRAGGTGWAHLWQALRKRREMP